MMHPLSAYTPFETLLFFQSLTTLDAKPASFAKISETLRNNKFVRDNARFDANRLNPEALEELYTTLIEEWQTNGRVTPTTPTNPKKRKISPSAGAFGKSHLAILPGLISHLYARYKELVTKEIQDDEKKYKEISQEIVELENEQEITAPSAEPPPASGKSAEGLPPPNVTPPPEAAIAEVAPNPDHSVEAAPSPTKPLETPPKPSAGPSPPQSQIQNHEPLQPAAPQAPSIQNKDTDPSKLIPLSNPPPHAKTATPNTTGPVSYHGIPSQPSASAAGSPIPPSQPEPTARRPASTTQAPQLPQAPPATKQHVKQAKIAPAHPLQSLPPQPLIPQLPTTSSGPQAAVADSEGLKGPATIIQASSAKAEATGRKGPLLGTLTMPNFQQWSPQTTPKTPIASVSPFTNPAYSNQPILERPVSSQHASHDIPGTGKQMPSQGFAPPPVTPSALRSVVNSPLSDIHGQPNPKPVRTPSVPATVNKRLPHVSINTPGSLTPWKQSPKLSLNIPYCPGSPPRPRPEDVSPISERGVSPFEGLREPQKKSVGGESGKPGRRGRKRSPPSLDLDNANAKVEKSTAQITSKRAGSTTSTWSRARSAASRDEESAHDTGSARRIKNENPSTPAGIPEDTEAETRAGRRRNLTLTASAEDTAVKTRGKRKRGLSEALELETPPSSAIREDLPPSVILCTRNFPRTGAPIMNDVAAHKLAGIFAKPITERDAPGYKDLIYRPQDLKSIKSAIHQGSRAVAAAAEATSIPADGESPLPGTPSKNTALILQKTPDLIPPKAIVNSSQVEKELIRMFANAVMYNLASERERGFGPAFPLTKTGSSMSYKNIPREKAAQPWGFEDGGMVHDTREMCDDVEKAVTRWRAAERTVEEMAGPNKSYLSLRRASVGDSNAEGES